MVIGERPTADLLSSISKEKRQGMDKVNTMKSQSSYLRHPLKEDLADLETLSISHDSYNLLKFHGSYQQDDREKRKKGADKAWQFMLRLKVPGGECPGTLYGVLDDLCENYGQKDLRMTTRQAFQIHGISKPNLKHVIKAIMDAGSTTIGGCGDINRNVMLPPAPIVSPLYARARKWAAICAELFVPQTDAFSEIWCDGEKLASVQYWKRHIVDAVEPLTKAQETEIDAKMQAMMREDNGRGIITNDPVEPLYGDTYLPRKFKMGVTVEGDNSIDVYINDIGIVVLEEGGFNVLVGGGLGRTHGRETTFARAANELCHATEETLPTVLKAIVAVQRDHGNREVRANARLKYLVHTLGIEAFRSLTSSYCGFELEPPMPMKPWRYSDWMGWHEAGDGTLFVGINVEQGRLKDYQGVNAPQLRSFLRDVFAQCPETSLILSPTQSMVIRNLSPNQRPVMDGLMERYGIKHIEQVDPIVRLSMACPALPLCGLAVTEAERYMPTMLVRIRNLLDFLDLGAEEIMVRMTGCPNGCARPYMAELAFVGDGRASYQLYVGGSPVLTRVGFPYKDRCKVATIENDLEPLFVMWRDHRDSSTEAFGDFVSRVGKDKLDAFVKSYQCIAPIYAAV